MHGDLKESRFLVIGGSSGIGLAGAMAAAKARAAVTIASRSQAKLDSALADLGEAAKGRQLDTTDHAAVESFFAGEAAWDHVVVSAAQTTSGPVRKLSLSEARATMDSKFWGAYHVARSAKIREHGSLCLISGFRSVRPSANTVLQGAVNAALEALARGRALKLAPIRVNAVSPGLIATPLWAGMAETEREAMFTSAAERIGQSSDVANAVLFLASSPVLDRLAVFDRRFFGVLRRLSHPVLAPSAGFGDIRLLEIDGPVQKALRYEISISERNPRTRAGASRSPVASPYVAVG